MLETGLGRAANAALAGLPGFTLTGDISGSDRFYAVDVTPPVVHGRRLRRRPPRARPRATTPSRPGWRSSGSGSLVVEAPPPMTAVRVGGRTLGLSNLDKPLYPDGWTKGEVIDYYARIADDDAAARPRPGAHPAALPRRRPGGHRRARDTGRDHAARGRLVLREERARRHPGLGAPTAGAHERGRHRLRRRRGDRDAGLAREPRRPRAARPAVDDRQRPARDRTACSTCPARSRGRRAAGRPGRRRPRPGCGDGRARLRPRRAARGRR